MSIRKKEKEFEIGEQKAIQGSHGSEIKETQNTDKGNPKYSMILSSWNIEEPLAQRFIVFPYRTCLRM